MYAVKIMSKKPISITIAKFLQGIEVQTILLAIETARAHFKIRKQAYTLQKERTWTRNLRNSIYWIKAQGCPSASGHLLLQ